MPIILKIEWGHNFGGVKSVTIAKLPGAVKERGWSVFLLNEG